MQIKLSNSTEDEYNSNVVVLLLISTIYKHLEPLPPKKINKSRYIYIYIYIDAMDMRYFLIEYKVNFVFESN